MGVCEGCQQNTAKRGGALCKDCIKKKDQESMDDSLLKDESSLRETLKDMQTSSQQNFDKLTTLINGVYGKLQAFDDRLKEVEKKTDSMDVRYAQQGKAIQVVQSDIADLQKETKSHDTTMKDVKTLLDKAKGEIDRLRECNNKLERFSRRNNLRLVGIPEKSDEDVEKLLSDILRDKFSMPDVVIERAHRVGPPSDRSEHGANRQRTDRPPRPRHIVFKVLNYKDKAQILKQKREKLGNETYYITDDQTDEDMATKRRLQPVIDKAKQENKRWRYTQGKLYIEGQLYREPNAASNPRESPSIAASNAGQSQPNAASNLGQRQSNAASNAGY